MLPLEQINKLMLKLFSTNPFNLDWGSITPDGYNEAERTALSIFNFDISSADKIERCIIFSVGKIIWLNKQLPKGAVQKVVFDLRGQPMTFLNRARNMKDNILGQIRQIDSSMIVNIEILI